MIMASYTYVFTEFPPEIHQAYDTFLRGDVPAGFSHFFLTEILSYKKEWVDNFVRRCQKISRVRARWIVHCSLTAGDISVESYGSGVSRNLAGDSCLYTLFHEMKTRYAGFFMPNFLIGFPNLRGHCYLISILTPLLHSYAFMDYMLDMAQKAFIDVNVGAVTLPQGRPFLMVESSYFWTKQIFQICKEYYRVTMKSSKMDEKNLPILFNRLCKGSSSPVQGAEYVSPDSDLVLDKCLVKNLCTSLRNFCHGGYSKAGGDERRAIQDIFFKLASENSEFCKEFFVRVKFNYVCRRCAGGPFDTQYSFPVLYLDGKKEIQEALHDAEGLCKAQGVSCSRDRDGFICKGTIRCVFECQIVQSPRMLIFVFLVNEESVRIPDSLELMVGDKPYTYHRLCSTYRFQCWKDKDGKSYGPFFHEPLPTDIKDTWHSYPSILTRTGFLDVNNGKIYETDVRIADKTSSGSTHFFQRSDYNDFFPQIDFDNVYALPSNL